MNTNNHTNMNLKTMTPWQAVDHILAMTAKERFDALMEMDIFARAEAVKSMTDEQKAAIATSARTDDELSAHMNTQLDIMEAATDDLIEEQKCQK